MTDSGCRKPLQRPSASLSSGTGQLNPRAPTSHGYSLLSLTPRTFRNQAPIRPGLPAW